MSLKKFGVRRLIEKSYLWCGIYFFQCTSVLHSVGELKREKNIYQKVTFSNLVDYSSALQRNKDSLIP